MTWRFINASVIGTSHEVRGGECEDDCYANIYPSGAGDDVLFMCAADGAGSASHGGEGARTATASSIAFAERACHKMTALGTEIATEVIAEVRKAILSKAESQGLSARDFACTFLGTFSSPSMGTLVFQIGDGGVVVDAGQGLELAVIPMSGEYANQTSFVTDSNVSAILSTKYWDQPAVRIGVFTDGLQRMALNLTTEQPHEPFFTRFFDALTYVRGEGEERLMDDLNQALERFLGSTQVNERTDDDKSLALAVLLSAEPATIGNEVRAEDQHPRQGEDDG